MKEAAGRLSGAPHVQSMRRYCDPAQGIVLQQATETDPDQIRLSCPSFLVGQEIYTTANAWSAFIHYRHNWRLKRRERV